MIFLNLQVPGSWFNIFFLYILQYFINIFGFQLANTKRCPKILIIWDIQYFNINNGFRGLT